MMTRIKAQLRSQAGVAMITVLMVGAGLTVLGSAAAFTAVQELRSGTDDRKAAEALAIAEAGVDRFIEQIRGGTLTWGEIRQAGCDASHPAITLQGQVGPGSFEAVFTAYNPFEDGDARQAPTACVASAGNPRGDSPKTAQWFAIESEGKHPTATRRIRQVARIGVLGLPVGVYAERFDANGDAGFNSISFLSPGDVSGREKMSFTGLDPYYTLSDFYGEGHSESTFIPAALHTLGSVYLKGSNQSNNVEHPPALNCTANKSPGTPGQSLWDQTGRGGNVTGTCSNWAGYASPGPAGGSFPPTSLITTLDPVVPKPNLSDQDYLTLRGSAKREGLYCLIKTGGTKECTRMGGSWTPAGTTTSVKVDDSDLAVPAGTPAIPNDFVAYFEFEDQSQALTNNQVEWGADWKFCNDDLALNKSVVLVIRNGGYDGEANTFVNGLVLAPEGKVELRGSHTIHGSVIAKQVDVQGTAQFQLDSCWVRNLPGPFLDVTPDRWSEIDR